ncbi:lipocalin/fatty-acid binding family protein [Kitasatospora viridis]|uniref:Cytosolic fatty acid binding protein n=1 Tax=Kitasatospora viridis TaxID=281105 RepID=A0A561TWA0_9ACTN|nr:lipocalin/fatty-acid binding family protein [Kitasatospora viridis]TWF91381.1 cytosolic fatty acid binding protein [Kitasatospora viridis]
MAGGAFTDFSGTYELVSSEGYEEYLESIKVDAATREVLAADPQTVEVRQEGDHYTFKSTVATKASVSQFTLGQEYVGDFGYGDDRQAKGIARRDGNRIILQRKAGTIETTAVYEISDEGFDVMLLGPNGVTAKRRYKRQP